MARPAKADLQRYFELEKERLSFKRQADDIAKQQKVLEEKFETYLREHGGAEKSLITCGYRIYFKLKRLAVGWKEEFLRVAELAGLDARSETERLIEAAGTKDELVIEEPKAKAS